MLRAVAVLYSVVMCVEFYVALLLYFPFLCCDLLCCVVLWRGVVLCCVVWWCLVLSRVTLSLYCMSCVLLLYCCFVLCSGVVSCIIILCHVSSRLRNVRS